MPRRDARPAAFWNSAAAACLAAAVGMAAWAGVAYLSSYDPPTPGPLLVVDELERDLGEITAGKPVDMEFAIANTGDRPLRVVSMDAG